MRIDQPFTLTILVASLLLTSGSASALAQPPPVLGQLVDIGNHRLHLYCTGQGSPTVIVAGGGFSFDWGLVQPAIALSHRICTYDPAGTASSDPDPSAKEPTCSDRVRDLHSLLERSNVPKRYVVVGFSIGGLVASLYAATFRADLAGIVLLDHAFIDVGDERSAAPLPSSSASDRPPALLLRTPIELDIEDDLNFSKLPELNRQLHH